MRAKLTFVCGLSVVATSVATAVEVTWKCVRLPLRHLQLDRADRTTAITLGSAQVAENNQLVHLSHSQVHFFQVRKALWVVAASLLQIFRL